MSLGGYGHFSYTKTVLHAYRINLKLDPNTAACIVALRPAIEGLIIRIAKDPQCITEMTSTDFKVIAVIRQLSTFDAGRYNLANIELPW